MARLITVEQAKREIKKLQDYVNLVENYKAETIEQKIVKEYALTNSITKVSERLSIEYDKVKDVLKGLGKDELHKIVRTGYMTKTKTSRSKTKRKLSFYKQD